MRDYSKVSGAFWTGKTGKAMRGDMQAQIIALYLLTSPHSNMIGVFHCPIIYMAHETGCPIEGASKGLQTLCEGGFCTYDEDTEMVWVHEMAKFQIDEQLKPSDKRVAGIQKQYANMPEGRIKSGFFEKYKDAFYLPKEDEKHKPLASPLQAPPKPEAGTGTETEGKPSCPIASDDSRFLKFWKAYPRKQGKGAAEKAFAKAKLNGHFDLMLTALESQKRSEQWQRDGGQFIPNPATWLNQKRWEDEPTQAKSGLELMFGVIE